MTIPKLQEAFRLICYLNDYDYIDRSYDNKIIVKFDEY